MHRVWRAILVLLILASAAYAQQSFIEQSLVINVEVPVRVYQGRLFVSDLALQDFEVLEDGVPQKVEACYLVRKAGIQRREEEKRYLPQTARHFYLFFEVNDYLPKLGDAVDYFLQNVLLPNDNLVIITPLRSYRLKDKALQAISREEIGLELKGLIRKDCLEGNAEFRSIVEELTDLSKSISVEMKSGVDDGAPVISSPATVGETGAGTTSGFPGVGDRRLNEQLLFYSSLLDKLDTLRSISQMKLIDFANHLARQDGQKYVYLFYQREYIPQVEPKIVNQYATLYQDNPYVFQALTNASRFRDREMMFDVDRVKRAYADASTAIHFLFITTPRPQITDVYMEERSEDIFSAFREMARATGGMFESSSNPAAMFQDALEASENYYLLYYTPKNVEDTGRNFRQIEVRVKKGDYTVLHRTGYFLR